MEQFNYNQENYPVAVCRECGKQLAPGVQFCTDCGCPVSKPEKFPMLNIIKIAVAAVLVIAAIVLLIGGSNVLNSDQMEFYVQHLESCEDNRRDCVRAMYQSSNSFFYSSYRDLVDSYDEMIADDKAEIAKLKGKATTQFVFAGLCAVAAVVVFVIPWKRVLDRGTV